MSIDVVCTTAMQLGEGPLWHPQEQVLYWVDIIEARLYRLDSVRGNYQMWHLPSEIGSIGWCAQGGLIAALRSEFALINTQTGRTQTLAAPLQGKENLMFNDGKCDRQGRFWSSSKDVAEQNPIAALYRLDQNQVSCMLTGLTIGNGIAWSPDNSLLYICDSPLRRIYQYEFDSITGQLGQCYVFATVKADAGFPDGLTVDSEGYIWSCHWDGWCITRYKPNGVIDGIIAMPVPRPTSCCFGGPTLNLLYITSASTGLSAEQLRTAPLSGQVFVINTGVKGLAEPAYTGFLGID